MTYLDEACGKTEPPDLYAPDIPDECWNCGAEIERLDPDGCCEACGERVEP
jgi:hypothetical protein